MRIGARYAPTDKDLEKAKEYGAAAVKAATKGRLKDYARYDYSTRGHEMNALAQIAFCSLVGLDVILRPSSRPKPSRYVVNDQTTGVKYISDPKRNLALSREKKKGTYANSYALMLHRDDGSLEYRGWATLEDIGGGRRLNEDTLIFPQGSLRDGEPGEKKPEQEVLFA